MLQVADLPGSDTLVTYVAKGEAKVLSGAHDEHRSRSGSYAWAQGAVLAS